MPHLRRNEDRLIHCSHDPVRGGTSASPALQICLEKLTATYSAAVAQASVGPSVRVLAFNTQESALQKDISGRKAVLAIQEQQHQEVADQHTRQG